MTGQDETPAADLPAQRRAGGPRHAAPRQGGQRRARLLAFAAVPTALLMGSSMAPDFALAATPAAGTCATTPDNPVTVTPVPKTKITPVPNPTKAAAAGAPGQVVGAAFTAPKLPANASAADRTAAATKVVQAAAVSPTAGLHQDLIGDIVKGVSGIFDPTQQNTSTTAPTTPSTKSAGTPSAAPSTPAPSSSAAPGASASPSPGASQAPSTAPGAPAGSSAPSTASAPATGAPSASASATPTPAPTNPSAVAKALASGDKSALCAVDTRSLAATRAQSGQIVPDQNWTLRSSRLALHGAVFGGVYEVHSPTTTYRVLKFTVNSVDIGDLDMSTIENTAAGGKPAKTFHVKGAPGSTSTMVNGPITMYVESLSGELAALYGIPLPPLGTITLTPDTLPQWLYNLIGAVPIPLDLTMTGVTAIQAGQFGGTLTIPGMHLYNDDTPYKG